MPHDVPLIDKFDRFFGENWRLEWPTQKGGPRIGTAIGGSQFPSLVANSKGPYVNQDEWRVAPFAFQVG